MISGALLGVLKDWIKVIQTPRNEDMKRTGKEKSKLKFRDKIIYIKVIHTHTLVIYIRYIFHIEIISISILYAKSKPREIVP